MKSTFSRLSVFLSLIFLVATMLIGTSFQWLYSQYLTKQAIDSLEKDATVISSLIRSCYADQSISSQDFYMALTVAVEVSGSDAVICDTDGKLLMCADAPMGCEHVGLRLDSGYCERLLKSGDFSATGVISGLYPEERHIVFRVVTDSATNTPRAIVMASTPVGHAVSAMHRISNSFFAVGLVVLLLAVIIMTFYVRKQSSPLRDMAKAAKAFGHGDFTSRVTTNGRNPQEVEELALAFNNMAASLEKSENQRQDFVANVSHELKTPMTSIAGYVDGILDGTIPPEKSRQYLVLVSSETKRLNRLVRSMLDIARLREKGGISEEEKSRFDLTELAGQVLISFEQKINEKNIDVQVEMPDYPVYTMANQDAINQVIYNLVDNGVKFCPNGGVLGIRVSIGKDKVYLSVYNDGEEIPPDELPLVFERFHKTDKSRSRNRDSWGLGLYIVKTILDSHGENISITSQNNRTEFTFTLPLVR